MQTSRITVSALQRELENGIIRIFDASFYLPDARRDPDDEFLNARIPGAQRFNIDKIADSTSPLPHMLPTAADFGTTLSALGMNTGDEVVVYDTTGLLGAARAWWMFRVFGHTAVRVLDGGFPAWLAAGGASEAGALTTPPPGHFVATLRPELVRTASQVEQLLNVPHTNIIDARPAGRFAGTTPEPRPGLRSGHIPGSVNVPLSSLLDARGVLKAEAELLRIFDEQNIDLQQPIITTCGSGITACCVALALEQIGAEDVAVFDGSWAEWGANPNLPIELL